ncbi:MAG: oligosaccharide flippase family protein [Patescibacteria group bacterium]
MILKLKKFTKTSFVRDIGILQVGNFFSILMGIVGSIFLARLLLPETYGMYGLIFAFVGVIGIFMNWGADYAGTTLLAEAYAKKDRDEVINILTYYIKLSFFTVFIIGILGIIFSPAITQLLYHDSQIGHLGRIILIGVCFNVVYNMLNMILQASRKIKQLVVFEIFNRIIFIFLPIAFVLLGFGLSGVVWGYFLSALIFLFISLLAIYFLSKKEELFINLKNIFSNFKKINFKKYFNFGFLIAINKNVGTLFSLLPIIILGILTVSSGVAYFKIALGYIGIPLMVLNPVSRLLGVQLPKSKTYGIKILRKHFYRVSLYSGLIFIILMIPFVVFSPFLINLFYGAEYIDSINLIYWLSLFGIISSFSVGLGPIYRTLDKMKIAVATVVVQTILMVLVALFLTMIISPLLSVIFSLIFCSIIFLFIHFYVLEKIFKKKIKNDIL